MKKKRVSLIGIIIFIILILIEIKGININDLSNNIKNNKEEKKEEQPVNKIELVNSNLYVYFIDVGQADAILIQNNNENMLIDAGNNEDGKKIVKFLQEKEITQFKYIVGTHPHEDHIGGLDDIINSFEIENVLLPNAYTTTKTFEDVLDAIDNKKLEITVPEIDSTLKLGDANITVLYSGDNPSDLNDASIVLRLDFGENSFLFTGDATTKVEKEILNKNLKVDVYKVAHHGSNSSNSKSFLDKVNPTYGIISTEQDNNYGHPHDEVLNRLETRNIKLYRTDILGTILVSSDGKNIDIKNFKTNTNG